MSLAATLPERLARARADMRSGLPVLLDGPGGLALAAAAETVSEARIAAMAALGTPVLAITRWRAETLKARAYDGDLARLEIPADAGLDWVRSVADPADDLMSPMKGPFRTERGGSSALHRAALGLAKTAHLLPAAVVVSIGPEALSECEGLTRLDTAAVEALSDTAPRLEKVVSGRVPMAVAEAGRVHIFRPRNGADEHYAVEIGQPDRSDAVLVRLHSACFTGDVLGSLKCDCGPQLQGALGMIGKAGAGVLLYLNQEGRGIGLANKMRAYALQDQGFDTVDANHRLGFEDDERDFRIGAAILKEMGFSSARLITNNPAKVGMLEANGIAVVERVPIAVGRGPLNEGYLDAKAKRSGHIL